MRRLLYRLRRKLLPPPAFSIDEVELRHLPGEVATLVESRMRTGLPTGTLDGERSVRLAHPAKPGHLIKIKGAGLSGGSVWFGTAHHSGLNAPVFDFDGRMMVDIASSHDTAWLGGASFQQAVTEYRMAKFLAANGYPVVPCLGFGRVRHKNFDSWFSVHELQEDWGRISPPRISFERNAEAYRYLGELLLELAVRHALIGYAFFVGAVDGPLVLKDLHPFRMADPVSMSRTSWVMQMFFALHIASQAATFFARRGDPGRDLGDLEVEVFKKVAPNVTIADHVILADTLFKPYMLKAPHRFDARVLQRVLGGNRITRGLLDICPDDYERA